MHLVMFDIDGTLVQSYNFDSKYYMQAVEEILDCSIDSDWSKYQHVTDSGILNEIIFNKGSGNQEDLIHRQVKRKFIERISNHLAVHGIEQIAGSADFISLLKERDDVAIAIATGGWKEIALLKLNAAGIDCTGIALASSSDHSSRIEIMNVAETRCGLHDYLSKTYFGDALWDKRAAARLGYNFILVGDQICHHKQITDFRHPPETLELIGL